MAIKEFSEVDMSEEQLSAVDWLLANVEHREYVMLGGYAGTGKTTCVKRLLSQLPDFAPCAYTGKAAHVMRRKGVPATTIHSLIYLPQEVLVDVEKIVIDPVTGLMIKKIVKKKKIRFDLATEELLDRNGRVEGFLIDEASMIGEALHKDLSSFKRPIIYVGDHGQLEPVASRKDAKGESFNLMKNPDVKLETLHRNADEIARFSMFLRHGGDPENWTRQKGCDGSQVRLLRWRDLTDEVLLETDQIICAWNKTRVDFNRTVREALGFSGKVPCVGDRVMCLENRRELKTFNGMQGVVQQVDHGLEILSFLPDGDEDVININYVLEQFNNPFRPEQRDPYGRVPMDYAYCCTAHKYQGSESDKVLVLGEKSRLWSMPRWNYTGASRAALKLDWVCG